MILVTGATGLIGSNLVRSLLLKGQQVRAIRRAHSKIPLILTKFETQIDWVIADMTDYFSVEDAMKDCTEVYHCAALVSFQPKDKVKMHSVNVGGTANLVNAAMHLGIRKLVYVSSIAAIGDAKYGDEIDENCKWVFSKKLSDYGISKFEAEREVWRGIAEGLNVAIVNPSIVLGYEENGKGAMSFINLIEKKSFFYTNGASGFVLVEDVCDIMIQLMKSTISGERFIVSSENLSFKQLFDMIAMQLKVSPPNMKAPTWLLFIFLYLQKGFYMFRSNESLFTKYSIRASKKNHIFSTEKLRKAIIFEFTPIKDGIKAIVKSKLKYE